MSNKAFDILRLLYKLHVHVANCQTGLVGSSIDMHFRAVKHKSFAGIEPVKFFGHVHINGWCGETAIAHSSFKKKKKPVECVHHCVEGMRDD